MMLKWIPWLVEEARKQHLLLGVPSIQVNLLVSKV
jgi:hypothetical protein